MGKCGCWTPTKAHLIFAWIASMNSIIWNHEVCSCLMKSRKLKKTIKIIKRMHARRKFGCKRKKVYWKWGFLLPKRNLEIDFFKLELFSWKWFDNSIQNCKFSIKKTNRGRGVHQCGQRSGAGYVYMQCHGATALFWNQIYSPYFSQCMDYFLRIHPSFSWNWQWAARSCIKHNSIWINISSATTSAILSFSTHWKAGFLICLSLSDGPVSNDEDGKPKPYNLF